MDGLAGLKVAVDVQHLFKPPPHDRDRGSEYRLVNGLKITEADATLVYAAELARALRARGAEVLENQPAAHVFVGSYAQRNRAAAAWGADVYLACHLNAGGGSYAAFEYFAGSSAGRLCYALGESLVKTFPSILRSKSVHLTTQDRGAVCIRECPAEMAAVICEPFFGDTQAMQAMLEHGQLLRVGDALAAGVGNWHAVPVLPV